MKRYYIGLGFPKDADQKLEEFTNKQNTIAHPLDSHLINDRKHRLTPQIKKFLENLSLQKDQIFEYRERDDRTVDRAVYEISFNKDQNIKLVIMEDGRIKTFWLNYKWDMHENLDARMYDTVAILKQINARLKNINLYIDS